MEILEVELNQIRLKTFKKTLCRGVSVVRIPPEAREPSLKNEYFIVSEKACMVERKTYKSKFC
jgi:hypothetical protein